MGYMGMGYKKWISGQRPRKAFSRDRKPIHSEIDHVRYSDFQPQKHESLYIKGINIASLLLILSILLGLFLIIRHWNGYVEQVQNDPHYNQKYKTLAERKAEEVAKADNLIAYQLPYYIENHYFDEAYKDLNLVLNRSPENYRANAAMVYYYLERCRTIDEDCDKVIPQANKHLLMFPYDEVVIDYKTQYYNHIGDTSTANLLNKKFLPQ